MLHDAVIEATCDRERCHESVFVPMEWVYHDLYDSSGHYDHRDTSAEEKLVDEFGWVVQDGKHFCSSFCEEKS